MDLYQPYRDPAVSDQERATKAVKDAPALGGPCSRWCKACEEDRIRWQAFEVVRRFVEGGPQ